MPFPVISTFSTTSMRLPHTDSLEATPQVVQVFLVETQSPTWRMPLLLSVCHVVTGHKECHVVNKQQHIANVLPQVVGVLKKEIMKTQSKDLDKAAEYRQLLVQAVHSCAVKFPDVAGKQAPPLLLRGQPGGYEEPATD